MEPARTSSEPRTTIRNRRAAIAEPPKTPLTATQPIAARVTRAARSATPRATAGSPASARRQDRPGAELADRRCRARAGPRPRLQTYRAGCRRRASRRVRLEAVQPAQRDSPIRARRDADSGRAEDATPKRARPAAI